MTKTNDLTSVEQFVLALMTQHGVGRVGFRFSKGTRQIAAVHFRSVTSLLAAPGVSESTHIPHMLTLSRKWAAVLPESDLWEIIIHEIAHIKTVNDGKPHGVHFQRAVREMGGRSTRRCFNPSVNIDGTPR